MCFKRFFINKIGKGFADAKRNMPLADKYWLKPREIFNFVEEKCCLTAREIFDYVKEKYDLWSEKCSPMVKRI
ncbi:hypothetical protein H8S20_15315 [Clostridium sp. NSJ-6]|uniref:Uncharacterized protein n=1 Tax=Clostridium hominis TaxID=2763036 RepID=A0ABR7DFR2_9CLOT|nr:hypothetical protein [Clostridium hominis]